MQDFLTTAEVAAMFRRSVDWFYRNRRKLERRGFPRPVVWNSYDPDAVSAWRRSQMPAPLRAALGDGAAVDAAAMTEELRANAERLASGVRRRRSRAA